MKKMFLLTALSAVLGLALIFSGCSNSVSDSSTPDSNATTPAEGDEQTGGEQTGGEATGGEQTGGEATGGEATGGETAGTDASDEVSGEAAGGENSGGTESEEEPHIPTDLETPLTLEAIENGTIEFWNPWTTFKYKINGGSFQTVEAQQVDIGGPTMYKAVITVHTGDVIALYADPIEGFEYGGPESFRINCTGNCYVYGNVMSLLDSEDFATKVVITQNGYFEGLFAGNTHIQMHTEKEMKLPATTISERCYADMFFGCTGLTEAPELPATQLKSKCYSCMFADCENLVSAPVLSATELADYCYNSMFQCCTSLVEPPELPATELAEFCYKTMFYGCTGLTSATDLPATQMKSHCYESMFDGCQSLVNVPELPATKLADSCYSYMFSHCINITNAPKLPATVLAKNCYRGMFSYCDNLTRAPDLIAPVLVDSCYGEMFSSCSKLNYVKCLATNILSFNSIMEWLFDTASEGTFVKEESTFFTPNNPSGIPSGWTQKYVHAINTGDPTGGFIIANPPKAAEGETVTLTIAPDEANGYTSYTGCGASYTDSEGTHGVTLTGTGNTLTFTMPDYDVNVTASFILN